MSGFIVPLFKLRQALQAVKVHADGKDDTLGVVRLLPGVDTLEVMATDRYTAALAVAPVALHEDDDADQIDLALDDIDKVLAVFKMPADKEQWEQAEVHITKIRDEVTFTDAGGLFEGQSLTVPAYDSSLPDLRPLIATPLRAPLYTDGQDLGVSQKHAAKIVTATKTYGYPAYTQLRGTTKPTFLVLVGPDFAAVVQPTVPITDAERADEDHEPDTPEVWRRAWRRSLDDADPLAAELAAYIHARTATALADDDEDGDDE